MASKPDAWEKPRSHGTPLTNREVQFLRNCYADRRSIAWAAEQLKCASRTVAKYYGFFREEGVPRVTPNPISAVRR